ncbi:NlpC/P60 family protein [Actinoplanes sp. NBRC 101535]|uniref:C40 family peptidase n=1 Tax=Actinoplanes sp. NBRC 101535 TaxID=3032196 RepID=UPI0024A169DD|nr:NlpC/P60 family protein [Actinoplanes sp. NBRC 101535]GLY08204.1 hypothetical protein Acsp01_85830 [Actinoplanes sp. NBRC 101535]
MRALLGGAAVVMSVVVPAEQAGAVAVAGARPVVAGVVMPAGMRAQGRVRAQAAGYAAGAQAAAGVQRKRSKIVAYARSKVGSAYRRGATGPKAFDCSGLTKKAYAKAGITLPHSSYQQAAKAKRIPRSQARPGDLVVGPGHVGIYMGSGKMIDAGNPRVGVRHRKMYRGLHVERLPALG